MATRLQEETELVERAASAYRTARREVLDLENPDSPGVLTRRQAEVLAALESAEMALRAHRAVTLASSQTPAASWPPPSCSGGFTPWLGENLDVLADELGLSLTLVQMDVPVGDLRLDIQAETHEGRAVIIENQLECTDHAHLGQLLVHASGLEAATVVWVAPTFREDHRRTLHWLNERTGSGVEFFGVVVGVVQIGDDPKAPVFEVVVRPNPRQKGVKNTGDRRAAAEGD